MSLQAIDWKINYSAVFAPKTRNQFESWAEFLAAKREHTKDRVQNLVEPLADVFCQKPQDEVAALLEQRIFAPVASPGVGIGEMLIAVEFNDQAGS